MRYDDLKELTENLQKCKGLGDLTELPAIMLVDALHSAILDKQKRWPRHWVDEVLAEALGSMDFTSLTAIKLQYIKELGLIDALANYLSIILDYSFAKFNSPKFFLAMARKLELG
jgi:hypothetical protein